MSNLLDSFTRLETEVSAELQEREDIVHTAILALLARKHHFQLGPPGVAKSLLVDRIMIRFGGLSDDDYFKTLLTKYSTPDEVFGPPDLAKLMPAPDPETGITPPAVFQRDTARRLPVATVAFTDEVFKGNSSVLNALLMAMNERQFDDGQGIIDIPISTIFGASNEMPQGEELGAMWDRLHLRHELRPLTDTTSFGNMMNSVLDGVFSKDVEAFLTLEDLTAAIAEVQNVTIGEVLVDALVELRHKLSAKGIEATDRRWTQTLDIIKAEAWLDGKDVAEVRHCRPLIHMMWDRPEDIRQVMNIVLDLADPLEREAQDLYEQLLIQESELRDALNDNESKKGLAGAAVEIYTKMDKLAEEHAVLAKKLTKAGRTLKVMDDFDERFNTVSEQVMLDGFGINPDTLPKSK